MKDKKIYLGAGLAFLLLMTISLSYAYFSASVSGNDNAKDVVVNAGTLSLVYADGPEIKVENIRPGKTITKEVTVKNTGTLDTNYNIIWQSLINEITNNELVLSATCQRLNANGTEDGTCKPITELSVKAKTISKNISIEAGFTHKYTFTFLFKETNSSQDYNQGKKFSGVLGIEEYKDIAIYCTYDGELTQGAEYVNGQYTYRYMQEGKSAYSGLAWNNISNNGWGVQLTDKASTDSVTSKVCTYINNKPVVSMSYMFSNSKATTLDVSNFDTSNVTNMGYMFYSSQATTLDLSNFDTSKVTNMGAMFYNSQTTTLDLSNFDTSKVTNMSSMFSFSQATTLDLSNFNTSKVTNMSLMFSNSKATTLDLSNFNTSKVTDMSYMFSGSQATTLDLSNFDTSNVIDMDSMFYNSKATTLDVSNFDTSKVTNMSSMFWNSKATTLDVSNFDTSKVTDMSYMFSGSQATTLDLSNFNTSKVTTMSNMFNKATNLKTIYVSNKFNTDKVTDSTKMFYSCTNLVGGAGTKYNSSYVDKTYARIDGGTSNPGYFTDIADKPSTFPTDSWATIVASVKANNKRGYKVGDTKEIDLGTYGTHTLRIANTSTPSECSRAGFSQTACGFVLEFADIITTHNMNDTETNIGGWSSTSMRTFVNNDIYNAIPSEIKNAIIDTTVVSGHGSASGETNFTTTDKLYLLVPKEIYTDFDDTADTAKDLTRTLDYYKNLGTSTSNYSGAIKKNGTSADWWWLRAAISNVSNGFLRVGNFGGWGSGFANYPRGVAPAFRLG